MEVIVNILEINKEMKPTERLNSIAFALATSIVFLLWGLLKIIPSTNPIVMAVIGLAISLGLYRLIAGFIVYLIKKSTFIKRKFLGPQFLQGTWVGFYIGPSGKERYIIERFEQEIDSLVIRGKSFDENSKFHSNWVSGSVNIDVQNGKITFVYDLAPIKEVKNNTGIGFLHFERDNQYSEPKGLTGFYADIHVGDKVQTMEVKISNFCNVPDEVALGNAKKVFTDNKSRFIV